MQKKGTSISRKYPSLRDIPTRTQYSWLEGRRLDDGAEGLWRVHDGIYDLTDFVERHPGGREWLELTKGTDITEAFEAHHISEGPERLLEKFKIRDAKEPRNYNLTFKEDGFFRTFKRRVREKLKTVDMVTPARLSNLYTDVLFIMTYVMAVAALVTKNYIVGFLAALTLTWCVICAHNYFHRRNNWRMYIFNLSFMSFKEWRISHALSHHLYTNSLHDLEISLGEPFLCWIPDPKIKNWFQRYASWIYGPFIYCLIYISEFIKKLVLSKSHLGLDDLIPFSVPLVMYLATGESITSVINTWLYIVFAGSFIFSLIGFNASHHHSGVVHEGDAIRQNSDWAIYQMDTAMDREDINRSHFFTLTFFGQHILHHIFPTLDHGVLAQFQPEFVQTLKEFEYDFRECSWFEHIIEQHKQLARIEPRTAYKGQVKKTK
ncbi:cytochrome b5-related protein-like [Lutzomyia longipalpis]|uniref:cytochrome b5-related protein-like n=1 Tax=Lutzomyia longipalpis TaxID=7200 RepID=UPI0024837082|nr:cytochrome b5-related protein-like [Lutzomyia longipalpis]